MAPAARARTLWTLLAVASVLSVALLALGLELVLRLGGEKPDNRTPRFSRCFATDDTGVFRATKYCVLDGDRINSRGFRGPEFARTDGPSILMLGDSFTWGAAASPLTASFADQVRAAGWTVFNTGIPVTSTNQYERLAAMWAPELKPAWVVVFFYLANDFDQPPMLPSKTTYYLTDDGSFINGFDINGKHLNPLTAYSYTYGLGRAGPLHCFSDFTRLTVVGSRVHRMLYALTTSHRTSPEPRQICRGPALQDALENLRRIRDTAEDFGAHFGLFLIPPKGGNQEVWGPCIDSRREFNPLWPSFLDADDWTRGSHAHFNNRGHAKYAQFILEELARHGRNTGAGREDDTVALAAGG